MEAKELRIGNLMEYARQSVYVLGIHQAATMITSHTLDLGYYTDSVGFERHESDEELKPIPLTEEWLLKFGFEFAFGQAYIPLGDDNDGHLLKDPKLGWILDDIEGFQIPLQPKYVHQLQNLYFALTGNELTIKQ